MSAIDLHIRARRATTLAYFLCSSALVFICLLLPFRSDATDAIIIGGGSDVLDSPARFEHSIGWIESVLAYQNVNAVILFNDGNDPESDTYEIPSDSAAERSLVLDRVFGQRFDHGSGQSFGQQRHYRDHALDSVIASTRATDLEATITSRLAEDSVDELLLVFSGHGRSSGAEANDTAALRLWDNSFVDVDTLQQWLSQSDKPVRFIFSQSYSGDFHRLAYSDALNSLQLGSPVHCGFSATSAYAQSETANTLAGADDYRDYSTYFFSAISGYEYSGEIISRFADLDQNGQIGLREAHLFALEEANSIDLSLSTSEDYLLRWQPWYLRWQPANKQLPNNEYTRIFRDLANRMGLDLDDNIAGTIRQKLETITQELSELQQQIDTREIEIHANRSTLQAAAIQRWPTLAQPYSQGYVELIRDAQLPAIQELLMQIQPQYDELNAQLKANDFSRSQQWDKRRKHTQYNKLLRLRYLALLKQQLQEYGSAQNIIDYRSLVACEEAPLTPTDTAVNVSEQM